MPLLYGLDQPSLLTLLNSQSTPPLALWTAHAGPSDSSFVEVLDDTSFPRSGADDDRPYTTSTTSTSSKSYQHPPPPPRVASSTHIPKHRHPGYLAARVIHIQSPKPDTYIQAGALRAASSPASSAGELGITLPYLGLQLCPLGARALSIEVGLADTRGRVGVVRLSSHKTAPTLHAHRAPPLVHLPLALPHAANAVTRWVDVGVHLPSLLALFPSLPAAAAGDGQHKDDDHDADGSSTTGRKRRRRGRGPPDLPDGPFLHTAYVRVYANCRLRRVWFSEEGDRSLDAPGVREEWGLYAGVLAADE